MSAPPPQPNRGGKARRDNEYERRGTANVFCAVEPKAGRHFTFATADRSGFEFARVACHLAMEYPDAKTIHLIVDNLNSHWRKLLTDAFGVEVAPSLGPLNGPLHAHPRKLAQPGRSRNRDLLVGNASVAERIPDLKRLSGEPGMESRVHHDRVKIN